MTEPNHNGDRRKYRSGSEFLAGVSSVKGLPDGEARFLYALAMKNCDWRTFESRPGNEALLIACNRTRKSLNNISERLIEKGLITLVSKGCGSGHANVYRINVEDPRFPEPKSRQKPGNNSYPVYDQQPGTNRFPLSDSEPQRSDTGNPVTEGKNPVIGTEKPGKANYHPSLESLPKDTSKHKGKRDTSPPKTGGDAASNGNGATSPAEPDFPNMKDRELLEHKTNYERILKTATHAPTRCKAEARLRLVNIELQNRNTPSRKE